MLGERIAAAGALLVGVRLFTRMLDLGALICFIKFLTPAAFGAVALAMSLVGIVEVVSDMPIGVALMRNAQAAKADLDTAFTLSFIRAVLVMLLLAASAWPLGAFYHEPQLKALVLFLSLAPACRALMSPRLALYQRDMKFRQVGAIEVLGKMLALPAGLVFTAHTGSYWGVALVSVLAPLVAAVASYVFAPYRPRFGLRGWRRFIDLMSWASLAQILGAASWQSERFVLGKAVSAASLGLFTTASDMSGVLVTSILRPTFSPLMAAFCRVDQDAGALRRAYLSSSAALAAIILPVLVGQALVAGPAMADLFGTRWAGAAVMIRWLSLSMISTLLGASFNPLAMARGRTDLMLWRNGVEFVTRVPLAIIGAIHFGVAGVIGARVISELATGIFACVAAARLIGVAPFAQLTAALHGAGPVLLMTACVLEAQRIIPAGAGDLARLAVQVGAGMASYAVGIAICLVFQPETRALVARGAAVLPLARLRAGR